VIAFMDTNININELADLRGIDFSDLGAACQSAGIFRYGDIIVRMSFPEEGPTLQELLEQYYAD
jgi:hypothetical protein